MIHRVVNRQRIHLHDLHVQVDVREVLDVGVDQLAPHREDADFDIRRFGRLEKLVAPFHVIQRKGNLLDGFEPDDLGNFLRLNRRELDEAGEAGDAADADRGDSALGDMPLDEIRQGRLDERFFIIAGIGKDVFVLDDLEVVDAKSAIPADELDCLQGAIADVDSPGETSAGHRSSSGLTSSITIGCGKAASRLLNSAARPKPSFAPLCELAAEG